MKKEKFNQQYGPWALIAGSVEGIGYAFSKAVAAMGINLVMVDYNGELLDKISQDLEKEYNIQTVTLQQDLNDDSYFENITSAVGDREIGLLIYVAAKSTVGSFFKFPMETQKRIININVRGPMSLSYHYGKMMRERKRGGIILMSSFTAFTGSPLFTNYGATKAYNLSLAEGLWDELKPYNVDVIACCAGATLTPTYIATNPREGSSSFPPEMTPEDMVDEVLKAIGKKPYIVPGFWNRFMNFLLSRFMSRKKRVKIMGANARKRYEE